ncbi:tetratricopeptide repeat-containing glycosyltransferase family 2 protein [Caldinitratiruptor microaerophilus]|uniref:Glycosyltransferase 2-like domain-containing protein n=1 Tax=Caldinitratiruptor microaerophilus TaxID=671077 RepID=A0AA35CJU4_9FIRM|nr:glycosyltransferase [Caldinitratiruptor microaerophilus]BDG59693.1 hypothetical protein caldi_07830 [Caldinitratiruptor microaerophilus]
MPPRVSLCMIVRDEAEALARCLRSAQGAYDELVVVDTGSVDDSPAVARRFGARVLRFPWCDDFAAARNHGLERARGDWLLWLDADDELPPGTAGRLRELVAEGGPEGYFFPTVSFLGGGLSDRSVTCLHLRLFRNRPHHRFRGAIHEQVTCDPGSCAVRQDIRVLHHGYRQHPERLRAKAERNRRILLQQLRRYPGSPWYLYHLGTEYLRLGHPDRAITCYREARKRALREGLVLPELWKKLAAVLSEHGDPGEAEEIVAEGLGLFPEYTDLEFVAGTVAHRQGRLGDALRHFRRCLAMGDAPVTFPREDGLGGCRALHAAGLVHFDLGNYPAAFELALAALARGPADTETLGLAVEALSSHLDGRELVRRLETRLEVTPEVAWLLVQLLARVGAYRAALYFLPRSTPAAPAAARALLAGICHLGAGEPSRSETSFLEAREAGAPAEEVNRYLALVHGCAGRRDPAGWQALAPSPQARLELAEKLLELGRARTGLRILREVVAGGEVSLRLEAGKACLRRGRYREACRLLLGVPSPRPDEVRVDLSLAAAGAGRVAFARRLLAETDPRRCRFETVCALAWSLLTAARAVLGAAPATAARCRDRKARLDRLPIWRWSVLRPVGGKRPWRVRKGNPRRGRGGRQGGAVDDGRLGDGQAAAAIALHDRPRRGGKSPKMLEERGRGV